MFLGLRSNGFEQRFSFFEQSNPKRDTQRWYKPVEQVVKKYHLKIKVIVSDRAAALIKLADSDYLDCPFIPDLFHLRLGAQIQQTLAQKVGCFIGKAWCKAEKAFIKIAKSDAYYSKRKPFEDCEWYFLEYLLHVAQVIITHYLT